MQGYQIQSNLRCDGTNVSIWWSTYWIPLPAYSGASIADLHSKFWTQKGGLIRTIMPIWFVWQTNRIREWTGSDWGAWSEFTEAAVTLGYWNPIAPMCTAPYDRYASVAGQRRHCLFHFGPIQQDWTYSQPMGRINNLLEQSFPAVHWLTGRVMDGTLDAYKPAVWVPKAASDGLLPLEGIAFSGYMGVRRSRRSTLLTP
jgi:hypothetical protein